MGHHENTGQTQRSHPHHLQCDSSIASLSVRGESVGEVETNFLHSQESINKSVRYVVSSTVVGAGAFPQPDVQNRVLAPTNHLKRVLNSGLVMREVLSLDVLRN